MKLTSESKFFLVIFAVTVVILGGALWWISRPSPAFTRNELMAGATAIRGGNPEASALLVEFSDFQCPACKVAKPVVDELTEKHPTQLLFIYRHFPLSQHPFAQEAARAAEAAGLQGKFWEMYDYLFENQETLSSEKIREGAALLGLDMEKFETDKESQIIKDKVARDLAGGNRFGVNATPTFYLNGRKLTLTSFEDLKQEVEKSIVE